MPACCIAEALYSFFTLRVASAKKAVETKLQSVPVKRVTAPSEIWSYGDKYMCIFYYYAT